jgi:hypothetical protein
MLLYHFCNPAGAVCNLKEVIVSLVHQRILVLVPFCEVRHPSDLGIGRIGSVGKEIIDRKHEIHLVLAGELSSGDVQGLL